MNRALPSPERWSVQRPGGVSFDPASGLTDSSGQLSTNVALGGMAARYQLTARTLAKTQKPIDLKIEEIALGYQEQLGFQLDNKYCARCHSPSLPPSASPTTTISQSSRTHSPKRHAQQDDDAELTSIISHGGPALNKSALMPPYGYNPQQERDRCADRLHPPDLRSSVSCFGNGVRET